MQFPRGTKVDADFGHGHIVAFVASGPHGSEEKYEIQNANGDGTTPMSYHEPEGDEKTGLTFKRLP
jgi:hypothetical protein